MAKSKIPLIVMLVFSVFGCILIGGYITLEIFTSDKVIKSKITAALEDATGGKLNIGKAHFELSKGLTLNKVSFVGKQAENLRIEAEEIFIKYEPLALLRGEILLNSILIVSPELFLVRKKGAIWQFLNGVKSFLDHTDIKYPTEHLKNGVTVKAANIHVFDETVFREGVLDVENVDMYGQQFGGSLRDINIKGIIKSGLWEGLELLVNTNLSTPEMKLEAKLKDKTMTEELMKELPVIGERFWKTYSPLGKFNFVCTLNFDNKDNQEKMDYFMELDVIDGEATYIKWPFLIKHINGKLEFSREGVFLKSVKGDVQNEGQQTPGEIDAFFGVGNAKKSINLGIPNFNITKKLLEMIPDVGEKVWNEYRPEGNIDLTIKYESNEDKTVTDYSAKASCKGIKAKNPFVPYEISNIIGLIEMDDRYVYLKNMSGYLLNGPKFNLSMLDGVINLKNKKKRFTVSIPNLDLTEDIVKSIPKKGKDIWARYKPTGQVDFTLNYRGFEDSVNDEYIITVDGKGNEIEFKDLSVELTDVIGRVVVNKNEVQLKNLRGYIINGDQLAQTVCDGVYKLKNRDKKTVFNVFDLRVTEDILNRFPEILGKEWLNIKPVGWVNVTLNDEVNEASGKDMHSIIIDTMGCEVGISFLPVTISDLNSRINIEGKHLTIRNFTGICCEGTVKGSIDTDISSPNEEYSGKLTFENISLQDIMTHFTKSKQTWSGLCEGNIDFKGKGEDIKNFTARGIAKLRDGYLSEVPILLSILKLLNLSLPKKERFHTANLKYTISGKVVNIEELEVLSDSVELGCVGTAKTDGTIDLIVVAGFNKETFSQIPFVGGLMDFVVGGVRKKLTKVQITGTLANPESTMIGLKPFTYPIKSIFDVLTSAKEHEKEDEAQKNPNSKKNEK